MPHLRNGPHYRGGRAEARKVEWTIIGGIIQCNNLQSMETSVYLWQSSLSSVIREEVIVTCLWIGHTHVTCGLLCGDPVPAYMYTLQCTFYHTPYPGLMPCFDEEHCIFCGWK